MLNCEDSLFYLNGIPGLGELEESCSIISELVGSYKVRGIKTISMGMSMGANGAIHYGAVCGVDYIFCCGLKEDIQNLSFTFGNNRNASKVKEHVSYSSLLDAYDGQAYLCCGDNEIKDYLSLMMMPDKHNIKRYAFSGKDHNILRYINRIYGIQSVIASIFKDQLVFSDITYSPSLPGEVVNALYLDFVGKNSHFGYESYDPSSISIYEKSAYLSHLVQIGKCSLAGCREKIGNASYSPYLLLRLLRADRGNSISHLCTFLDSIDDSFNEGYFFRAFRWVDKGQVISNRSIVERLCNLRDRYFSNGRLKEYLDSIK